MALSTLSAIRSRIRESLRTMKVRVVGSGAFQSGRSKNSEMTLSLVVPCYNVAPYLDKFLTSIFSQTVLPKRFEVILVNDGSSDRTGEILDEWEVRYRKHVRVVHQPNSGVSAARNAGLALATGTWIGFPDPDDFLDPDYFKYMLSEVKRKNANPLLAVVSNLIFYFEDRNLYSDTHPLRYRFKKPFTRLPSKDLKNFMQLSTSVAWMHRPTLVHLSIQFESQVKPNFEDGHLFNRLLLLAPEGTVSFVAKAKYFYRKRADQSSLIDNSKNDHRWYTDCFRHGYLDLIKLSHAIHGRVPIHIQRLCLYDVFWRFRHLVNHPHRSSFLTAAQRADFLSLLWEVFSYIDGDTIAGFNLAGCTEEHKVALLSIFKGRRRDETAVYVEQVDHAAGLIQFSYHTGGDDHFDLKVMVNGGECEPRFRSRRTADFMGQTYFRQHFFWVPLTYGDDVQFDRQGPCQIKKGGKFLGQRVDWAALSSAVAPIGPTAPTDSVRRQRTHVLAHRDRYRGGVVLIDRVNKADDNAEHLYRYLMLSGRADRAWFILSPESADWPRLMAEGFKLLPFGSDEHIAAQMNADFLLSSHADQPILWPVPRADFCDLARFRFVFLQHGVTTNDLSNWLNAKPIRAFVTSTPYEYHDIARADGNYIFSEREVMLTGFPRHDALLARARAEENVDSILFMPTWRKFLTDETLINGTRRGKVDHFLESEYAKNWLALLKSPQLEKVAQQQNLRIVLAPHPNMSIYLEDMDLPSHVQTVNVLEIASYQELFAKARLAVTCFSSAATEVAFLQRPVVYFQFDTDRIFSGEHNYRPGYFSFKDDGFGPVAETVEDAVACIEKALRGEEDPVYAERREKTFPFRDGKCCERVWQEVTKIRRSGLQGVTAEGT